MSLSDVRALTFDTGGTILDWHSGFSAALAAAGRKHGIERDWAALANELRRRSLKAMLNLGEHEPPAYTIDGAHRTALEAILEENGLSAFTKADMHAIAYEAPHGFTCWPDFPAVLPQLRGRYIVASFTLLSYRLIIDTAKKNGLSWDAVFSCEGIGKYKVLPEAYRAVARYLQLDPSQCCMVACHNFDLDAARAVGFRTAFVRRPAEWGKEDPPGREPNPANDIIVDSFPELAKALGVAV
jgi:2-haloacid dehalogenase